MLNSLSEFYATLEESDESIIEEQNTPPELTLRLWFKRKHLHPHMMLVGYVLNQCNSDILPFPHKAVYQM